MDRFRSLDFIIFALIALLIAWEAIQYSELTDLQKLVHMLETREIQTQGVTR
jgi:hypothetical protein